MCSEEKTYIIKIPNQEKPLKVIFEENSSNKNSSIPPACQTCSNHPSNGGSGICHCTLGLPKITY